MLPIDFNAPLDSTALVAEVAAGTFAFKNKIKGTQIRAIWDNLSVFIISTLQRQKGVLLPNLGNFKVGPVVGDSSQKKIRPSFSLLEGRYGGVSQERPRYIVGGRSPIVQPNYGLLSVQAAVHRGATQRLVGELLQRLGVHILSGRPLKVRDPMLPHFHLVKLLGHAWKCQQQLGCQQIVIFQYHDRI
ncbi:hypothetical protein DUNSADRAFT_1173 [Dunaliella salina]|uniref:CCDC81 HU domain-containing protein n=1 Tax=Dunaliella salina TaxID=3046 RepID=A0ABQ7GXI3_DUNSA|nr:hypothetical protein DUNSADRAFT_1173 [Dunaliella salina]|eukprot:KAF5839300.1 hypothetical protein DUNSADRAFT_1173 [Dunaliella salina]